MMIKPGLALLLLSAAMQCTVAQPTNKKPAEPIAIPMEPAYWHYDTSGVEFITHLDVRAARIKKPPPFSPKNIQFTNGTIEYDVALGMGFPGITFRLSPDGRQGDNFYLRYFGTHSPYSRTTLQYAAMIDSMSMWDLTDEYQAGARLNIPGWNHIKLVVYGKQMKAYVNDMHRPALIIPLLEGGVETGPIAFSGGEVTIANLVIRPDAVEDLDPLPGYIPARQDTRYLRHWQVSPAIPFPAGKDLTPPLSYLGGQAACPEYPDSTTRWTMLNTDDRAMLNLTRLLGSTPFQKRRLAWSKTTIVSETDQVRTLQLGFSDELWLFVNGQLLHVDKNYFGTPGQRFPAGRCTLENTSIRLPLKKGNNEILVALANHFYGWGIIARLDDMEGIQLP